MSEDSEIIRVFKCPCEGEKYILAGEPNDKPALSEKLEYAHYISMGCDVLNMTISEFRKGNWQYCGKHITL